MRTIIYCQHMLNFFHYEIAQKTFICGEFIHEKVLKNYDIMVNIFNFKNYNESIYLVFYECDTIKYMFYYNENKYVLNDINGETLINSSNFIDIVNYMDNHELNKFVFD